MSEPTILHASLPHYTPLTAEDLDVIRKALVTSARSEIQDNNHAAFKRYWEVLKKLNTSCNTLRTTL